MLNRPDVRWIQRLNNYQIALKRLLNAVQLSHIRPLSELEEQGLIQAFEFTHELSWKVMKDFLGEQDGGLSISGSKDAVRMAFSRGLITNGEMWMEMIASRNLSSHTYDEATAHQVVQRVTLEYMALFAAFSAEMDRRRHD
jgi:nucleotidyltransferase substrate binding protein (TIGR01987 family)